MGLGIKTRLKKGWYSLRYIKANLSIPNTEELNALLLCHALEKGMGTENVKHGFGQEKANKLLGVLNDMRNHGKTNSFAFQESLAILNAYIEFQKTDGVLLPSLEEQVKKLNGALDNSCRGGFYMGGGYRVPYWYKYRLSFLC